MTNRPLNKDHVNIVLKSIVENSGNMVIFALDNKYRYTVFNTSHFMTMKRIWGYEISLGKSMLDYIKDPADRLKARINFDRALAGESFNLTEDYGDSEFGRRYYDIAYNPVRDQQNKIIGVSGILHDITEEIKVRKALKINEAKLKESNAAKDRFFRIIAHDLRNPFNAILNFSEILSEKFKEFDDDKKEELINLIFSSSKQAYNLLESLLEWSMAQANRISYNPDNYALKDFFIEAVSQARITANKKEIHLSYNLKEDITVYSDKYMLATILRNLISNAVKFTNRNGEIVVSGTKQVNETIISVRDNGVGMDKKTLEKLFDIDNKKINWGTENEKGTGIGLLLCKEFIDRHHGKIHVESEPGKGSIFFFSIPLLKDDTISKSHVE